MKQGSADGNALKALAPGQWLSVATVDAGGALQARRVTEGVVFYWRGRDGGRTVRVRLGMYDGAVPPRRLTLTDDGTLSIAGARAVAAEVALAAADAARAGTSRAARVAADREALAAREAAAKEQAAAERTEATARAVTVAQAWRAYVAARRSHWGERHYADHVRMVAAGGEKAKRGTRGRGVTIAGPLHALMALRLRDLTAERIAVWAKAEGQTRPTRARLALRHLRAFLGWCAEHSKYRQIVTDASAAKGKTARERLGKAKAKTDALERGQLAAWFKAVQALDNAAARAYLQCMVLTGARPGELLALRWSDVNWQWKGIGLRDKVEGDRDIPLTPYVSHLLSALPKRGEFVFAGKDADAAMSKPHKPLERACAVAGVEGLTLHGLRRSFGTLSEWLEIPAGVVAQIQGHKPSATAEKHYRVRPLDLLRVHHERLEAWMLEQAGIVFDASIQPAKLRAVA